MSSINSFADSLFRFLFGWARGLLQRIWDAAFSGGFSGFFTWLGDHWLLVTLLLCLIGTVVDFAVWMIRWRPYLVWRTKLRRVLRFLGGRGEESTNPRQFARGYRGAVALDMSQMGYMPPPPEEKLTEEEWKSPTGRWQRSQGMEPADQTPAAPAAPSPVVTAPPMGTPPFTGARQPAPTQPMAAPAPAAQMAPAMPAVVPAGYQQAAPGYSSAGYQPATMPQQAQSAPYAPAAAPQQEDSGRMRRFTPAADYELPPIEPSRPNSAYTTDLPSARRKRRSDKYDRRRATWRQRLANATEEEEGMLDGLPPVVDRQQAFHEPVYPQQQPDGYAPWPNGQQSNGNMNV
ncbi:MAG: hypothetical protein IKP32_09780 [Clostridia bacterium]|nr:hypothetical protein [Clostridia bacterium]